jgi:tetratricopeptide (TPR) repeat protein
LYRQAIQEDPTYALAYTGRADAWIMAGIHCLMPPEEAFPRARADARDALRMGPGLPEATISEAWVKLCFNRDLAGAKRDFRQAIHLKPECPFAHNGVCLLHIALGRPREGVKAMAKARGLDANAPFLNALLADSHYQARDYEKAAEQAKRALSSDPDFPVGHACLGKAYLQIGRPDEAIQHLERARDLAMGSPLMLGFLAYAYASANQSGHAEEILRQLLHRRNVQKAYVPSFFIALVYLGLGKFDLALTEIGKAIKERSHWVLFLGTEPMFDPLRHSKRFKRLLEML